MDKDESRFWTICLGIFSIVTLSAFIALYAPLGTAEGYGASIRPATPVSLGITVLAIGGWIPILVLGVRQLFSKPYRYGLYSLAIGCAHFACSRFLSWWLIDARGHHWGS